MHLSYPSAIVAALSFVPSPNGAQAKAAPSIATPSCDYGEPSQSAAPQLSQFNFLIGDFTITARVFADGKWGTIIDNPRPRLVGRYILGGMAIQDEWYDNDPGLDPGTQRGVITRIYDSDAGEWKVAWTYSKNPQITDLRVTMVDGLLTMRTFSPKQPNFDAYFERTDADTWTRTAFKTQEDGSRTPLWQAIATRIACLEG